jgi:SAM-dependent methyltransferase
LDREFIAKHWYASVYEQFENQTHDVEFLLNQLSKQAGSAPQNILEAACGGGRICVPLAQAGHTVTGFDADEHMLLRCYRRMKGLNNIRCYKADATTADWGSGFDVVVLAGNILINIESDMDYTLAQATFIRKASEALRTGGHLFLDFDLHFDPASFFHRLRESSYFNGTDDMGTSGRAVGYGGVYDPVTQICTGAGHLEITTNNGEQFILAEQSSKHIPTQAQVYRWLAEAGLTIEKTYKNYSDEPLREPIDESTYRATIWAWKG